ncbi:MAG: hypothetical protein HCAMLNBO_00851 [Candidatus Brocadia fulgida]|nr:hypothetical protein [Candidatus Brocadia fulgida]
MRVIVEEHLMVFTLYRWVFQSGVDRLHLMFQMENILKGRTGLFKYGLFPEGKTFLGEIAGVCILCTNKTAAAWFNQFADEPEEGGFPGAIGSDQTDPIISPDVEGNVVHNGF